METKVFEIRDTDHFGVGLAIRLDTETEAERWLFARLGYGKDPLLQEQYILMTFMNKPEIQFDPFRWGDRTRKGAHQYVIRHWEELESGDVVDVRVHLGEANEPAQSERLPADLGVEL